jgi:crotonobetainyl-CoA:carnitine CoA-transferase CaiB-like acyl-CoA transferase
MINAAYAGTRVIEISSGLSAAVTGRFFADLGADVVRMEALEQRPAHPGERAVLAWARARKRVLASPDRGRLGIADLEPLVSDADVVITDLSPHRWAESFPSLDAMSDTYPGVVFVDVTGFGRVGPYVDYLAGDLVVLALSGYLFTCGLNDREPLRLGVDLVDIAAGVNAAGGAMVGLHHARRTGAGQVVEVSALRTMLCMAMSFPTSYSFQGTIRRRSSTGMVSVGIMLRCRDGHALVNTFRTPSEMLYVLLDDERLLDQKFGDYLGREVNQQEMAEIMAEAAARKTMRELFETGQELRLQNAMVQSPLQTPSDPQHGVRRFFQPLGLDDGGAIHAPVAPVLPVEARHDNAHRGGETLEAVEPARWRQDPVARPALAEPGRDALEGLKVLELTFAWAGPFMGRILADHGAHVVKIESRRYPDTARGADLVDLSFGANDRWMDRSLAYIIANPDKYHVGMDLTDPAAKDVLLDLVRWADVVIENFTPRVLPNLGLGWELFRSVNPSVIMISASGFGQQGPYRDYGAWGWGLECQAGITHQTGYLGEPDPLLFIPTMPDPLSAAAGVAAILAALEERRRTGDGQRIDLSQYECATFATLIDILRGGETGTDRPRTGNRHTWKAPHGVYPCDGADAWVTVAVDTDEQWLRLCETIGRPGLAAEEGLRTHAARYGEHDRIDGAIAEWTRGRNKHQAMHMLQRAGVPAGAVQNAKDLHHDPQVQALEYFRAAWGAELGLRIWPGTWYGMQATPGDVRRGTSTFGEDNERVLRDLLGYDLEKVKALLASDAFSDVADGLEKPAAPGVPVETMLERGMILSWDDDYQVLPAEVAERNQRWRREHSLPEVCLDGRVD